MSSYSIPIPEGLDIIIDLQTTTIRRKWFSGVHWLPFIFQLIFTCIWDGFLIIWYFVMFYQLLKNPIHIGQVLMLFAPCLHVALGLYFAYDILSLVLNVTDITLSADQIHISTHPLPSFWDKSVKKENMVAFSYDYTLLNRYGDTFDVYYTNSSNKRKIFIANIHLRKQAEYICGYLKQTYTPQS